ncbi:ABC transporter ATP-binding protein [Staphylococcus sp. SQ8-PEA]|uniref:ABC transporter ATP-binding protein n=1 Tax=Staphylococcus marylandisciuri TaxID=2981529 RepID=A0ABT2QSX0_9STAP|nr:ABC transporter ATP-binding protein [Staphylococcus marylandisciuri]MCU5747047.1 ABC transporter ATP-binding protein [Staphylococcus marylandisciuri]
MKSSIEAHNVSKDLDHICILENMNFHIPKNSITLIKGSNGSGKSVTLKLIAQLYKVTRGSININGQISYAPDHFPDYLNLTVEEYLIFVSKCYRMSFNNDKLRKMIKGLNLHNFLNYKIKNCSKGTQQKVNLAQCLIKNADIYIFDEPFVGLDNNSIDYLIDYLSNLKQTATIVLSSHERYINERLVTDIINIETKLHTSVQNQRKNKKIIVLDNFSNIEPSEIVNNSDFDYNIIEEDNKLKLKICVPLTITNKVLYELIQKGAIIDTVKNEEDNE